MAEPKRSTASKKQSASLSTTVTELWELVLAYAKQETVEPLKALENAFRPLVKDLPSELEPATGFGQEENE